MIVSNGLDIQQIYLQGGRPRVIKYLKKRVREEILDPSAEKWQRMS
jgi:hypothetical protein